MTKLVLREAKPAERLSRARQRLKLIDACITALHQHGPSRTTIDKVVSIADMSPGIVNFYFETKAALLVAALEHLAVEFETRVLEPLAALRNTPVAALDRLIDLYLDADVASARKVSVWYSFWGESSSRREYFTICGKRDLAFAELVQDLVARLIRQTRLVHLDADAVALGLVGCLEMVWQEIAFQEEADLDRDRAKQRCRAYLRSVFPGHFSATVLRLGGVGELPSHAYQSADAFREDLRMFQRHWQFACAEQEVAQAGRYVAWHSAAGRCLVVCGADGAIRGFTNTCLHRPHLLVAGDSGTLGPDITCGADGRSYGLDGISLDGEGQETLAKLHVAVANGVVFVCQDAPMEAAGSGFSLDEYVAHGGWLSYRLEANWKLVMEHWADTYLDASARLIGTVSEPAKIAACEASVSAMWQLEPAAGSGSQLLYLRLAARQGDHGRRLARRLIWPNVLLETRPDGVTVRQVLPVAPGRSVVRVRLYRPALPDRGLDAMSYLAARFDRVWQQEDIRAIESMQTGLAWQEGGSEKIGPALRGFFAWVRGAVTGAYG